VIIDDEALVDQYHLRKCTNTFNFNEKGFAEYLMSDAGRGLGEIGANAAAKSLHYFFSYRPYSQKTQLDVILNKTNIRNYVDHLKKVKAYAGTTILERVGWLTAAIDYLTESTNKSIKLHLRVEEIEKTLKQIKSILSKKTIKKQRATQARLSAAKVKYKRCSYIVSYCPILYQK